MDENKVAAGVGAVFWLVPPDFQADGGMAAYVDFTRPACDALQGRRQASGRSLGPGSRGYRESRAGDGFQQIPGEAFKSRLSESGRSEAMAQAVLDMMAAKNEGLDNAEPRTGQSGTPTRLRVLVRRRIEADGSQRVDHMHI